MMHSKSGSELWLHGSLISTHRFNNTIFYGMPFVAQGLFLNKTDSCVVSAYYHFSAIVLWRPLLDLDIKIPNDERSVSELLLWHGISILNELEDCKHSFPIDFLRGSNATMFFFYVTGFLLVFLLDRYRETACAPFLSTCRFFYDTSRFWPACKAMLKGLLAVMHQLKLKLPQEVNMLVTFSDDSEGHTLPGVASHGDIPISWTLPQHTDLVDLLSDDGTDSERAGVELGDLISKWSAIAIT